MRDKTLFWLSCLIVAILVVNGFGIYFNPKPSPPIKTISIRAVTHEVKYLGTAQFQLTVQKNRDDCNAEFAWRFVSTRGDVKSTEARKGGKFREGTLTRTINVALPEAIEPGEWTVEPRGWAFCPDDPRPWPVLFPISPIVKIKVVP